MLIKSSEKKEKNIVEVIVEVDAEEFLTAVNEAFRKNRNQIAVPGFRKGKAPRKIIERMYGASVFHEEALDLILPSVLSHAVKESDLNLVGYPSITKVDIKEAEAGADVTIELSVYPEVNVGEYKGITAIKPVYDVSDAEIDSEIAGIRLRNARMETADRPAINDDTTVIDFEGFVDGEPFEGGKGEDQELVLGSGAFIPGFEEKMHGMVVGEERDIDLVFPENYVENLAGKPVVFKVKLKELREKILPDLDDEFAKDVSEFDTLEEYRASIRERLLESKEAQADAAFENALIEKVIDSMDADVPEVMVDQQLETALENFSSEVSSYGMDPGTYLQMMNTTPEAFRANMRKTSEKQVRVILALERIAELEGIEASDEDVENEYASAAERYGMEPDDLKESVEADKIKREVRLRNAIKLIKDNATAENPPETDISENMADSNDSVDDTDDKTEKAKKPSPKKSAAKKGAARSDEEIVESSELNELNAQSDAPVSDSDTEKPTEAQQKKATTRSASSVKKAQGDAANEASAEEASTSSQTAKTPVRKPRKPKAEESPKDDIEEKTVE